MKPKALDPDELAAANLWRCEAIARRVTRRRPRDFEEAYSVALVGLAEAIRTFAAGRGEGGFGLHAHVTIHSRVLSALHAAAPKGYRRRMGLPRREAPSVVPLSALAARPPDVAPHDSAPGWATEWEESVLALARQLPPRHGELLRCRFLHADGADAEGAARRMGLSKGTVHHLSRELLAMLREKAPRVEHLRGA